MRDRFVNNLVHALDLVDAHERVDFRKQFGQLFAETLRQAAGNDQPLAAVLRVADFGRFEDGIDAFLLRGIDEGTTVDDDDIRAGRVIR